ncbi:hypothetical protein [Nostoc sp.]
MNLKYGEFDILEQELESLPPMHRVAFAVWRENPRFRKAVA